MVIDVSIVIQYGVFIPRVAQNVQSQVKRQVEESTGLDVLEVNVHVVGIDKVKSNLTVNEA